MISMVIKLQHYWVKMCCTDIVMTSFNRVEEIVYGNDAVTYYYDAAGMRVKQSLSNGIVTSYTYDANNNMTVLEAKSTDGDVLNSYKYKYDKLGNRKTMTTMKGTTTYTYDNNSQLVVADYSDETSERYEYDSKRK